MFAAIYLPNFYLQAAVRHQPELHARPVALIDGEMTKATIMQINAASEQLGVRCGMAPSQGLARCLELTVKMRNRAQETLLSEMVLQFAFTLAPFVEATAPGVCTIEFTDNRNLDRKVACVIEQLAQAEITATGGIAQTPDISLLAAHLARPVLQVGDVRTFLASLPIETFALA